MLLFLWSLLLLVVYAEAFPTRPGSCTSPVPVTGSHLNSAGGSLGDYGLSVVHGDNSAVLNPLAVNTIQAGARMRIELVTLTFSFYRGYLMKLYDPINGADATTWFFPEPNDRNGAIVDTCVPERAGSVGHTDNQMKAVSAGILEVPIPTNGLILEVTVVVNNNATTGQSRWFSDSYTIDILDDSVLVPPSIVESVTNSPSMTVLTAPPTQYPVTSAPVPIFDRKTPLPTPGAPTTPFPTYFTNVDYYDDMPRQIWGKTLPTGFIDRGNGVSLSPDDAYLYITRSNGHLDVLDATNGDLLFEYTPQRLGTLPVTCQSGVTFATDFDGVTTAAYTIVDQIPDLVGSTVGEAPRSRVVVVTVGPNPQLMFESVAILGVAKGTPVLTEGTLPGRYIFVTLNLATGNSSHPLMGQFNILDTATDGQVVFSENSTMGTGTIDQYGPLGSSSRPFSGKYEGGFSNFNDVVVWTTQNENGVGSDGYTRAFQFPSVFLPEFPVPLSTILLRDVRWNALARPTLSKNGQGLFIGIRESEVRAWVRDSSFQAGATWGQQLQRNQFAAGQAILNAGTLSSDETLIFYTSAGTTLAAINVFDGSIQWEHRTNDFFTSEPKVSPGDNRVFAITSENGIISIDVGSGDLVWTWQCSDADTSIAQCRDRIRGEFSISSDGRTLYYGDIVGNIRALEIGITTKSKSNSGAAIYATLGALLVVAVSMLLAYY